MLGTGARLGPYEIVAQLGSGGMGEVWRGRDPRLGRDVAIKILFPKLAADPGRMAGFEREAKVLAALNHPHIASIYGLEEAGTTHALPALIMELVEGPTLAERLRKGALPLDDALSMARQIAEAMEYAHAHGIVHRDLKPGNVKLRPDGVVKVLDFGLAKAVAPPLDSAADSDADSAGDSPEVSAQFTVHLPAGAAGTIAGTAAYMSPEQAKGKRVDARSDVWSFGVVLFEMLAGRRPFAAESGAETTVQVLTSTPDWALLPAATPPPIRTLLRRCLTRDLRRRLQAIGEARVVIEEVLDGTPEEGSLPSGERAVAAAPLRPSRRSAALVALGIFALAVLVGTWATRRGRRPDQVARRAVLFSVPLPAGERFVGVPPAFSPDGRRIAFLTQSMTRGPITLRTHSLDSSEGAVVREPQEVFAAFWSPDSRWLGYMVPGAIRKLEVATGTIETVCKCADLGRGASWGEDGTILFAPNTNSAIFRIPAAGGEPVAVTRLTAGVDLSHRFPAFLPGGRHFLYTVWSNSREVREREGGVFLGSLDPKDDGGGRRLSPLASSTEFLPPGYLLAQRDGKLVALPFDLERLELAGDALTIADRVAFAGTTGALLASASRRGDVLYATQWRAHAADLRWFGRDGSAGAEVQRRLETNGEDLRLSPDGTRFAVTRLPTTSDVWDVWIGELERGTLSRLTHGVNDSFWPGWSPDGARVAFTNRDSGEEDLYVRAADATAPANLVYRSQQQDTRVSDWSRDGRRLLFDATDKRGGARWQIWMLDFEDGVARALLSDAAANMRSAVWSPDGRWLAYVSDESSRDEAYVRPFPALDRKWQLSREGGTAPHWRSDGREIVFRGADDAIWSVAIAPTDRHPTPGAPRRLFAVDARASGVAPAPDHSRFLVSLAPEWETIHLEPMRVILDWTPAVQPAGPGG